MGEEEREKGGGGEGVLKKLSELVGNRMGALQYLYCDVVPTEMHKKRQQAPSKVLTWHLAS
jgi:hypothetical protein